MKYVTYSILQLKKFIISNVWMAMKALFMIQ